MTSFRSRSTIAFSALLCVAQTVHAEPVRAAEAEPAKPASAAVSPEPQETSASFGDWVVRCARPADKRVCEVAQSLILKGQQAPIAQIAFGGDKEQTVTILVPVNIAFAKPPTIGTDEAHAISLTYRRCLPGGCLADAKLDPAIVKDMRGASKPGRLTFVDATERSITLPLSFRGLAQALDDLGKEVAAR